MSGNTQIPPVLYMEDYRTSDFKYFPFEGVTSFSFEKDVLQKKKNLPPPLKYYKNNIYVSFTSYNLTY